MQLMAMARASAAAARGPAGQGPRGDGQLPAPVWPVRELQTYYNKSLTIPAISIRTQCRSRMEFSQCGTFEIKCNSSQPPDCWHWCLQVAVFCRLVGSRKMEFAHDAINGSADTAAHQDQNAAAPQHIVTFENTKNKEGQKVLAACEGLSRMIPEVTEWWPGIRTRRRSREQSCVVRARRRHSQLPHAPLSRNRNAHALVLVYLQRVERIGNAAPAPHRA